MKLSVVGSPLFCPASCSTYYRCCEICETVKLWGSGLSLVFIFFFPFLRSRMAVSHIMLNDSYVTYASCACLSYITHKNIYGLLQNLPKCFVKFKKKLSKNTFRGKHLFKTFPQFVQEVPPSAGQENLNKAQRCRISLIFISVMRY